LIFFGFSVSIDDNVAIVGTTGKEDLAGAAYIYRLQSGIWVEETKIQASDKEDEDFFGSSVSICDSVVIVGAIGEDTGGSDAGAAYFFQLQSGVWAEKAKIQALDIESGDQMGLSVSVSKDVTIIGAFGEDTGGSEAGAAYIFKLNTLMSTCQVENINPTIPTCNTDGDILLNVTYEGINLSTTQTVVVESDALGFFKGEVVGVGSSPISVKLLKPKSSGTLMLQLRDEENLACSSTFSINIPNCNVAVIVPTLSEWGIIFLAVCLLCLATIFILAPAFQPHQRVNAFKLSVFPFNTSSYIHVWGPVIFITVLGFSIAVILFDYTLTFADPIGATLCSFPIAYCWHLIDSLKQV